MEQPKVFIVGMGVVSPLGGLDRMWRGLLSNDTSGIGINTFNTFRTVFEEYNPASDGLEKTIAAQVRDFNVLDYMDRKEARQIDPYCQFALVTAMQAVTQSGLRIDQMDGNRMGVFIGTGEGGLCTLEYQSRILAKKGANGVSPRLVPMVMPSSAVGIIASRYGCHGPCNTYNAACASGIVGIGEAFWSIRRGEIDVAIAGGSEAVNTPLCYSGFMNMRALSAFTDDPTRQSRPFDRDRKGFVLGEGAGMFLLVSSAIAARYDLRILGEIVGYGRTQDAYDITAPHPEGTYAAGAIQAALNDARIGIDEITYFNAHGTGTRLNDRTEVKAFRTIFGDRAARIPTSATKSMIGHGMGAGGAIEIAACVMTGIDKAAHPTANLDNIAIECEGVDHIRGVPRHIPRGAILKTSFGFSGQNTAIILMSAD